MRVKDAVTDILSRKGKTQVWLANKAGFATRQALYDTLTKRHTRLDTLLRICDALGCELAILYKDLEYTITEDEKK